MYKYTFTFKKDDIFLEVITSDRDYINAEMEKWVLALSSREAKPVNPLKQPEKVLEDTKKTVSKTEFDNVLNTKLVEEPTDKIVEKQVAEAQNVIASIKQVITEKNPETMHDYLIVAAHYLSEKEGLDRFSIKQINAKVFAFAKKPIDHSLIQKAVNNGYLQIVPDYTGLADVTEYALTSEGEAYYLNEI
ncbi:MAG: hypothetical protein WC197_07550 [Candidatus Gastranaerophilaceae bacterium]